MAELQTGLKEAVSGHGGLYLISGEPGIGKTRLANELCALAEKGHASVLWGRCWEGEGAPPLWPWVQVIRSLAEASSVAELASQMGSGAAYLAQIVPEVREKLGSLPPAATSPESEHARFYLFDAAARFFKKAAQSKPLVLVLDDLHWADKPSLLLLEFIARELRDARILVIGTYREAEARESGPLADAFAALARLGHPIPLRGLGEADVALFMEAIGSGTVDAELVAAVRRTSGGNPFFVDEIVRLLAAEGIQVPVGGRLPIPDSVRAVIRRRIGALPGPVRSILSAASVVGREFELAVLEHALDTPASDVEESLTRAATAGLVVRGSGQSGRYEFVHALIRETIYEDLRPTERTRLHAGIGRVLEHLYGANLEPHLAEMARHFLRAEDLDKAVDYSVRAGRRAMAVHAYEDADGHFERALEAMDRTAADEAFRCELLVSLGEAQCRTEGFGSAPETLRHAADLARKLSLPTLFARAALAFQGPFVVGTSAHRRLLEEALELLPVDSALRTNVMCRLAREIDFGFDPLKGAALAKDALEAARRLGDPSLIARALAVCHLASWKFPNVAERVPLATEGIRLAEDVGDMELIQNARVGQIRDSLVLGNIAEIRRGIEDYARTAEELRQPVHLVYAHTIRAILAFIQGRFAEAEMRIQGALTAAGSAPAPGAMRIVAIQKSWLNRQRGDLTEALRALEDEQGRLFPEGLSVSLRCARASHYAEAGRESEARRELEALSERNFAPIFRDANWPVNLASLTSVSALLGDAKRAATLYEMLLPCAGQIIVGGPSVIVLGATSHYLGLLATTMNRFEDAERHFEDALVKSTNMEAPPWTARTQYHYAEILLRRGGSGDREKALGLVEEAFKTATAIGMKGLAARAETLKAEALRIGSGAPQPPAESSIDTVAAAFERDRADVRSVTAPDGTVTLVFSDMEGFTEMTERLGDRAALEVMRAHNAIVREQMKAHGGYELELQGDGFLLAFSKAGGALRCGVAIQRELAAYSAEHPAQPIRVRIGIHTGEPIKEADKFFGKSVILAARIAAQAHGGEILVSSIVRELCESDHDLRFDQAREVELKGISGKRRVFQVLWSEGEEAVQPPVALEASPLPEGNLFRREGDYWTLAFEGQAFRLKDTKGLRYLGELLRNPGRELHVLDLAAAGQERVRAAAGQLAAAGAAVSADLGDAGEMLDAQAKTEYRRRLEDLREELEEAERFNDVERATRLRQEIDFIGEEIARATGLGGRDRKAASAAERARLSVTLAIKAATKRITENSAPLGRHLAATIKTGKFCSYTPDPRLAISWQV